MILMVLEPLAKVARQIIKKPSTLQYPEEREALTDNYKGIHRLDMKTCISCSACALICPNKTITMVETETDKGTKKMPEINLERCLFCDLCEEVCPPKCLILTKDYSLEAYDRRDYVRRPEELV
jgi:NADH-quinone oxidoreductase subunit I